MMALSLNYHAIIGINTSIRERGVNFKVLKSMWLGPSCCMTMARPLVLYGYGTHVTEIVG